MGHRDPQCRFARWDLGHQCTDAFGVPLRPDMPCAAEARQQIADEGKAAR